MAAQAARRVLRVGRQNAGAFAVSDSDHKPWNEVTKDLFGDDFPGKRHRFVAGLNEVHLDLAVDRPEHARRDLDNPGEDRRIADRPDAFSTMASIGPEILAALERARQRL